ncbi:hypothetical protein Cyast_0717 [Cyanobacterium stanieri PCC 7202]|uniref:Polysaccharide pyruvyl transferase domain-containing protein n=1 Tax=Cyanobacterium stanieri (strain ATCC 29140 / PCC 7202) TaxID=292563 RepID=K9YID0_CYASC|nr:hypothetical protein Cyast_0717 [Cyanobacterium stanieri PCC 7202]
MSEQINKAPQIAVWGSYLWGNFGDDVMAIMVSRHLQKQGFHPVVYKLDAKLAEYYGISSESDINILFSGSIACIVGGGGLLCPDNLMDNEWKKFYHSLSQYPIPVHFCSIGGDGNSSLPLLSLYAIKSLLLPNIKSGTVRLESDVKLFEELEIDCEFYPDIILSSPIFFPVNSDNYVETKAQKNSKFSIMINLSKRNNIRIIFKLINLLFIFCHSKITYLRTHLSWLNPSKPPFLDYEYLGSESDEQVVRYENIEQVRDALLNSDLIISCKLHAGVFALSYGIPFISINGAKKTKAFFDQANINSYFSIGRFYLLRLFFLILNRKKLSSIIDAIHHNTKLPIFRQKSYGHFEAIDKFISKYYASTL